MGGCNLLILSCPLLFVVFMTSSSGAKCQSVLYNNGLRTLGSSKEISKINTGLTVQTAAANAFSFDDAYRSKKIMMGGLFINCTVYFRLMLAVHPNNTLTSTIQTNEKWAGKCGRMAAPAEPELKYQWQLWP